MGEAVLKEMPKQGDVGKFIPHVKKGGKGLKG